MSKMCIFLEEDEVEVLKSALKDAIVNNRVLLEKFDRLASAYVKISKELEEQRKKDC